VVKGLTKGRDRKGDKSAQLVLKGLSFVSLAFCHDDKKTKKRTDSLSWK